LRAGVSDAVVESAVAETAIARRNQVFLGADRCHELLALRILQSDILIMKPRRILPPDGSQKSLRVPRHKGFLSRHSRIPGGSDHRKSPNPYVESPITGAP